MNAMYSTSFKREYKLWHKKNPGKEQLLVRAINLFIEDAFHPLLRTYKLKGKPKDRYAFSVAYDKNCILF